MAYRQQVMLVPANASGNGASDPQVTGPERLRLPVTVDQLVCKHRQLVDLAY
jgi:hypothetical protein